VTCSASRRRYKPGAQVGAGPVRSWVVEIAEIDPYDEALTHAWWDVSRRADELGRPWTEFPSWPSARATITVPNESADRVLLGAFDGGHTTTAMTGAAAVGLPLLDNTHHGFVQIYVDPARRGEGTGSALLEAAEQVIRRHERRTLLIETPTPLAGPDSAGLAFLRHHGFSIAITDEHRVLDLFATESRWPALAARAAPHHRDYRLVTWEDVVPEEYVDGYCALQVAFNDLAPAGELELEAEQWDKDRVRSKEKRFAKRGRRELVTAAVAPDGSLVALTEVCVDDASPDRADQGGTLVLEGHRGHRLGLAVKLANQAALRTRHRLCRLVHTWNADVNAAMNAINDQLGFESVELLHEMQRKVGR
jgi:GNAT superfamily N-acetyltransferase